MSYRCLPAKVIALVKFTTRVLLWALGGAIAGAAVGGVYGLLFATLYEILHSQMEKMGTFGVFFAGAGAVAGALTGAFARIFEEARAADWHTAARREGTGNGGPWSEVRTGASAPREGDVVLVVENQVIPANGEIVQGVAVIDESAVTGESTPAVGMAEGNRATVFGGTRILSGRIFVRLSGTVRPT